jgi:hypothetical protein
MKNRKDKPLLIRLLNTVSAFTLIGAVIYLFIAGMSLSLSLILLSALGGISVPVVASGSDGFFDCVASIFEAFIEGIIDIFATIGELFGSLFG